MNEGGEKGGGKEKKSKLLGKISYSRGVRGELLWGMREEGKSSEMGKEVSCLRR